MDKSHEKVSLKNYMEVNLEIGDKGISIHEHLDLDLLRNEDGLIEPTILNEIMADLGTKMLRAYFAQKDELDTMDYEGDLE